jgi:hypothetical protein
VERQKAGEEKTKGEQRRERSKDEMEKRVGYEEKKVQNAWNE